MYQKHELFAELSSVDIAETLKACALEQKDEYMEDEADRFRECRALIEQGKTYKQTAAQFRKQDKLKQTGDVQPDTNELEISELLTLASEQVGKRISLIEAGKILSACGLLDKEEYTSVECDRFVEACTLIKQQGKTYQEVAIHFGVTSSDDELIEKVHNLLGQVSSTQADLIRTALPLMAVEQLQEVKALFWRMTAKRLKKYVDSGQLEAEIRTASKSVLATSLGKHLGLLMPNSSPKKAKNLLG